MKTLKEKESKKLTMKKDIKRELFEMVYQWGRVGIIVDETCPAFNGIVDKLLEEQEQSYRAEILKEKEEKGSIKRLTK